MSLKHVDLSRIRDEDLTSEQRQEVERRFQAFARALAKAKAPKAQPAPKTISKWTPRAYRSPT